MLYFLLLSKKAITIFVDFFYQLNSVCYQPYAASILPLVFKGPRYFAIKNLPPQMFLMLVVTNESKVDWGCTQIMLMKKTWCGKFSLTLC